VFLYKVTFEVGEFALSKDVDVQVWLDKRAYQKLPLLAHVHSDCFICMNNDLMEEFENFKKSVSQGSDSPVSLIEYNELIEFWMR
jgi:hypothetical protein